MSNKIKSKQNLSSLSINFQVIYNENKEMINLYLLKE